MQMLEHREKAILLIIKRYSMFLMVLGGLIMIYPVFILLASKLIIMLNGDFINIDRGKFGHAILRSSISGGYLLVSGIGIFFNKRWGIIIGFIMLIIGLLFISSIFSKNDILFIQIVLIVLSFGLTAFYCLPFLVWNKFK